MLYLCRGYGVLVCLVGPLLVSLCFTLFVCLSICQCILFIGLLIVICLFNCFVSGYIVEENGTIFIW